MEGRKLLSLSSVSSGCNFSSCVQCTVLYRRCTVSADGVAPMYSYGVDGATVSRNLAESEETELRGQKTLT